MGASTQGTASTIQAGEFAGAGWAGGPHAVRDAIREAVERLGGTPPALVLAFPHASWSPHRVLAQADDATGGCPWAGMTSEGVMTADGLREDGCSAVAFG